MRNITKDIIEECASWHNHTMYSNIHFRDSSNRVNELIDKAIELGLKGLGITDHGVLCGHIDAIKYIKELKKDNPKLDFKLGLGCEIYLIHKEQLERMKVDENYRIKFYHFILIAKDRKGYEILKKISTRGWENSFTYKGLMRTPLYYEDLEELLQENNGNLIASSACLGSELSALILNEQDNDIRKHLDYMKKLFKDDYYIELQPSHSEDQIKYNKSALQYAKELNLKAIITTDSHYLRQEDRVVHTAFLKSQDAERETDGFYDTTYLMTSKEIRSYCEYMSAEEFDNCMKNTLEIADKIEEFDLHETTKVPNAKTIKLIDNYINGLNDCDLSKYKYIKLYSESPYRIDQILYQQLDIGLKKHNIDYSTEVLNRINLELEALWEISENLNQRLSSYYILTKEIVEIIWRVSLVGVSRGSAGAFFICYLLDIIQMNPMDTNQPYWRHISKERPELPRLYWAG